MNPEIAEALLRVVMGEAAEGDFPDQLGVLRDLAIYKYDEYGQYVPGRQFIASLAGWLTQFDSGVERQNALRYVRERLMYVSDIEMRHLVLQRQFTEGCSETTGGRRGVWRESGWPDGCATAPPPATAATPQHPTVPGAASRAPHGTPVAC